MAFVKNQAAEYRVTSKSQLIQIDLACFFFFLPLNLRNKPRGNSAKKAVSQKSHFFFKATVFGEENKIIIYEDLQKDIRILND